MSSKSNSSSSTTQSDPEEMGDLRRGPWTVEEDMKLINYIATHGEGRWNSLARCAGLKRTGKSCRLRWLNYLRPDGRRGNITLEEQLMILELHSRWGNRWSKIAQHLPGRTDNEIKNYWRTRVQKHAKQLKCDVNSKQFKDAIKYLWMPRLIERIQAASTAATATSAVNTTAMARITNDHFINNNNNNNGGDVGTEQLAMPHQSHVIGNNDQYVVAPSYTPENPSTGASSDSFGTQVSSISDLTGEYYNIPVNHNPNQDYLPTGYAESMISPTGNYNQGLDFQAMEQNNQWLDAGATTDSFWNVEDIWYLQQFNNNNINM